MNIIFGTPEEFLPAVDDFIEGPIDITPGFPFGSSIQTQVFVSLFCVHTDMIILPANIMR